MLFRRFGFLQKRLLLYKQDELREMETELDILDKIDEIHNPGVLVSRVSDDIESPKRRQLIADIEIKFKEYGQYLKLE